MARLFPTTVKDALQSSVPTDAIHVQGWVRTRRDSKDFSFIELNDGSGLRNLQIIAKNTLPNYAALPRLTTRASVSVRGALVASQGKGQKWELVADKIDVVGTSDDSYPLQKKWSHAGVSPRDRASLSPLESFWLRLSCAEPARIRHSQVLSGTRFRLRPYADHHRKRLRRRRRIVSRHNDRLQKPQRTKGGEIDFAGDFFARQTYLTVSGQLEPEAFALALSNVYTFGPTFRAENSNTSRHASEFWMIEPEMAFCDLNGTMDLAEEIVKHLILDVRKHCPEEMELFAKFVDKALRAHF
jgi:asparaginyl-tRNA synthetase